MHILVSFLLIFGLIGLVLGAVTLRSSQDLVDRTVAASFSGSADLALQDLRRLEDTAKAAAESLAAHSIMQTSVRAERRDGLEALATVLRSVPGISAAYIGWPDGDFMLLRPIGQHRQRLGAPQEAAWLAQWTGGNGPKYEFLDAGLAVVSTSIRVDYTFDPRTRPWFIDASETVETVVTSPYIFYTTREPGITAARRTLSGAVAGVDLSLWDLSERLPRDLPVPSTTAAIVNAEGGLLAFHDIGGLRGILAKSEDSATALGSESLPQIEEADSAILTALAQKWREQPRDFRGTLTAGGRDWLATTVALDRKGTAFLMAAAADELGSGPKAVQARLLKIFGVTLLLAIPLVWFAARFLARPVERFAGDLDRIAALDFSPPPPTETRVKELTELGSSIAETRAALRERIKELSCLYHVLELCSESSRELSQICRGIAQLLVSSFLHDDTAVARIVVKGEVYTSDFWEEPHASLRAPLDATEADLGFVEVGYREEREAQSDGEGAFLREERALVDAVAAHVGNMLRDREQSRKLTQSERLSAIGELTGGIAHDFNNLLTVILGNAELLEVSRVPPDEIARHASTISAAAERASELTHRLLAFARRQPLEPQVTSVNDLIDGMAEILRRTLGEQIEIRTVTADDLWHAYIDPAQLENALLNLAINARDAMPSGGRLTIGTSNGSFSDPGGDPSVTVEPGDYAVISVSDTGLGMPAEVQARAFEPFFTTKEVGKGNGLGLSMVYGFIKQSRGQVRIYSELNQGTTIKLFLPRAATDAEAKLDAPAESPLSGGSEKILLVEDNQLVREHVVEQLSALGYQVDAVRDGLEALEMLKPSPRYDLLFTDMVMPGGISGLQLAEAAAALDPNLPVLFTSGHSEDSLSQLRQLNPGARLLTKPYRRRELATVVRQVLDEARETRSVRPPPDSRKR
ncbi:MAG: ATP-binding protein [Rhodovibrionaceae bacterium]